MNALLKEKNAHTIVIKALDILNKLNFNFLAFDNAIFNNPYSLVHPGYIYYIWGKFLLKQNNSSEANVKFKASVDIFEKLVRSAINNSEYENAGEFLIQQLKAEGHLMPVSESIKNSHKMAVKIFENLADIHDDAYYIESEIEVKKLYEKYSGVRFNLLEMEYLYRQVLTRYLHHAEEIDEKGELNAIKIASYLTAVRYLNCISRTLTQKDEELKKSILNKVIVEISTQINAINRKQEEEKGQYSQKLLKINLYLGLGKAYGFLNEKKNGLFFYNKILKELDNLFKDPVLIPSIVKSKTILYKIENYYKIQDIEIYSKEFFEQTVVLLEKFDLFDLKAQVISELNELEDNNENKASIDEDLFENIVRFCEQLINSFEKELLNSQSRNQLTKTIQNKYYAFCTHYIYQCVKKVGTKKKIN